MYIPCEPFFEFLNGNPVAEDCGLKSLLPSADLILRTRVETLGSCGAHFRIFPHLGATSIRLECCLRRNAAVAHDAPRQSARS